MIPSQNNKIFGVTRQFLLVGAFFLILGLFPKAVTAAFFPDSGNRTLTGDWDFGSGGVEIENNTAIPGACTVGQIFIDTNATSGQQLYACEGGAFVLQGDGPIPYNYILNPTGANTIAFAGFSNTWTSTMDGGSVFTITNTAALTGAEYMAALTYDPQNDAEAVFMRMYDNNGTELEFSFDPNGAVYASRYAAIDSANTKDATTYIDMGTTADSMAFVANGTEWMKLIEDAQDIAVFNDGGASVDFRFESNGSTIALFLDGSTDRVGVLGSAPNEELEVQGDVRLDFNNAATTNGVCHSGADDDSGPTTDRSLVVCSGAPGDIAEWYDTTGTEAGDIVTITDEILTVHSPAFSWDGTKREGEQLTEHISILKKTDKAYDPKSVGVISSSPVKNFGRSLLDYGSAPGPLGLTGRLKVKVSLENGAIKPGDLITTSSTPGVGMKATMPGRVVGMALASFDETNIKPDKEYGKVMLFINPHWWAGEMLGNLRLNEKITEIKEESNRLRLKFEDLRERMEYLISYNNGEGA